MEIKGIWHGIQAVLAATGRFLGWFLGGFDGLIYALIAFVVVDYLTGLGRGFLEKKLSSRIGAHGIVKKVAIFLIVGTAHLVDVYLLHDGDALRTATIFFYLSNEGLSLLENAAAIGAPIPSPFKDALAQLHKRGNKNNDEEDSGNG